MSPIQITVFTGFLGSGKTTTILALLSQLPTGYGTVLLKNEFVDSKIAEQASVTAVSEILNGCMCCILVGQMKNALLEIRDKYRPDRIIIESSGSALPATLALQIRQLETEFPDDFKLDSIATVVDAENFTGYEDTSPTAKLQAKFCDVILINKWEHVSERQLDIVMDHLGALNDLTPKIRCKGKNGVSKDLIFGVDTKLYSLASSVEVVENKGASREHDNEVETCTVWRGGELSHSHDSHAGGSGSGPHEHEHEHSHGHGQGESGIAPLTRNALENALAALSKESVYRVKGFVQLIDGELSSLYILNWAFGRFDLTTYQPSSKDELFGDVRLTIMGERGEVKRLAKKFAVAIQSKCH